MLRVYCAGPLFNAGERAEMDRIAATLECAGLATFLPHRDGLEFAKLKPELERMGASADEATHIVDHAIFALDTYQLLEQCDVVVANLNGRVPDEGTIVEATLAWHARKPLVLYKADARSVLAGTDNPMLSGLGNFTLIDDLSALPGAIEEALDSRARDKVAEAMALGASITALRHGAEGVAAIASALLQRKRNSGTF